MLAQVPQPAPGPPGVLVAPPTASDEEEYLAAVRASRRLHRPWLELSEDPARFAALLARRELEEYESYLVRHAACGRLAGFVNVNNIVRGAFHSAYLGYGGFAGHEGRGLMTCGVAAVIDAAFGDLGLHRLEANVQPGNARSLALVRRLGFEREGYSPRYLFVDGDWRDHERWAMRREVWAARGSAVPPGQRGA